MYGHVLHGLVGVFVAQIVGQILVDGDPQLLPLNADVLGLDGSFVAIDDQGVDPGGGFAGEPAVVPLLHGLARPAFKGVGTVRRRPRPQIHGFPGQGNIGVNDKLFHIRGNFAPQLRLVGDGSGKIFRDRDPHFLTGLYHDAFGLDSRIGALIGVYDDILDKGGDIGVIPALGQGVHFLAGPRRKGVGAVIRPSPKIRDAPALRNLDDHGDHGFVCALVRESRHGQHSEKQHDGQQNSKHLFHGLTSCFFVGKPNIASVFPIVNAGLRK